MRADTGCGMTREELVDSLGTIARSGTASFMQQLKVTARIEKNTTV
jgi:molecular chaperone HtpG